MKDFSIKNLTRSNERRKLFNPISMGSYKISIQADEYAYCEPREDGLHPSSYTEMEVAFLSNDNNLLSEPFAYVPVQIIEEVIKDAEEMYMCDVYDDLSECIKEHHGVHNELNNKKQ